MREIIHDLIHAFLAIALVFSRRRSRGFERDMLDRIYQKGKRR